MSLGGRPKEVEQGLSGGGSGEGRERGVGSREKNGCARTSLLSLTLPDDSVTLQARRFDPVGGCVTPWASKRRTTAPVTALGLSDEGVVAHERLRLCGARAKRLAHVVNMDFMECSQIAPQSAKVVP